MRKRCILCGRLFNSVIGENVCPDCETEEELCELDEMADPLVICPMLEE